MSDLSTGRDVKRPPIEMPPLPPEPQEAAPIAQASQDAIIPQDQMSGFSQEGGEDGKSTQEQEASTAQKQEVPDAGSNGQRESAQARNFRELREKAERAARERDDLAQQIKDLKSQIAQKDDYNLNPDDLVEGKHLAQVLKEQKAMNERLKAYEQQRQLADAESRLKAKYADFDQVVNESTILALKEADPKAAEAIKASSHDPEAAFSLAYMAIKFNNLVKSSPRNDLEAQRAQQNSNKPRPLNTVAAQHTESPISRMNAFAQGELTKEMQAQYLKEMQDARKGY